MIDWTALGRETVEILRAYLRIDTTNPPGNEIAGARFLEEVLRREGIASRTVESAPGRANLVARLSGDGALGGIVLHHHIDVVYADRRYWAVDPFGGEIRDGFLYGRGAIDMKSTGILQLAAVLALKRAGTRLKRDLILLATADEEAGSAYGAGFLAEHHPDWLQGAEYAISELGGIEIDPHYRAPFAHIVISEKTGLPLRLIARGAPGHGSMPCPTRRRTGSSARCTVSSPPSAVPACCRRCRRTSGAWPGCCRRTRARASTRSRRRSAIPAFAPGSSRAASGRPWCGRRSPSTCCGAARS